LPEAEHRPNANSSIHSGTSLSQRFRATRQLTEDLLEPLSEADATIQSMEDASPAKWHAAHTTWFWETFVLRDHAPEYALFDEQFPFLFNSYYEAEGDRIARRNRGLVTRPALAQVLEWRAHVDAAMEDLLDHPACADLIALGIAHEQQHIELLLTDIKHALSKNPIGPAMWNTPPVKAPQQVDGWLEHPGGIARIGHQSDDFAFDNEGPAHRVLLDPFALSRRLVTNGEWDEFIADGGYRDHRLWLSDAWAWLDHCDITAPLYWHEDEHFTHCGWQKRDPDAPVSHISFFEADAFATWSGARLPTEFEWEAVARGQDVPENAPRFDANAGNQLNTASPPQPVGTGELFGDVWQFTRSSYSPYPRFQPAAGAVGEYNGKFMAGQWVLKGASCATVRGHSRHSYRNFFYSQQRWQFTGLRLARDI